MDLNKRLETLNLVLESFLIQAQELSEVRVKRMKRIPASIRMKRKRAYRKKRFKIKRKQKLLRRKPRSKRLAKRRAKIRKRLKIKPGSRKRISVVR
jgi:hypothetical protein